MNQRDEALFASLAKAAAPRVVAGDPAHKLTQLKHAEIGKVENKYEIKKFHKEEPPQNLKDPFLPYGCMLKYGFATAGGRDVAKAHANLFKGGAQQYLSKFLILLLAACSMNHV